VLKLTERSSRAYLNNAPRGRACGILAIAALMMVTAAVNGQAKSGGRNPLVGDTAAVELPLAHDVSAKLDRKDIRHAIQKVGDWQLQKAEAGFDQDWTFAALYTGFMAVPKEANGDKYQAAMLAMGKKFQWQMLPRVTHADDLAVSQTYLDLYLRDHDPAMIAATRARVDALMQMPDDPEKPLWWWCDALYMAPSVLVKLSKATGDRKYLDYMDHEWWITSGLLYSPKNRLYFRDKSYFDAHEKNGASPFWSRGNGWVFAGLARVLSQMPEDYPTRAKYIAQYREMADEIASIQRKDGLWGAGLLDPDSYPLPEVSGSAFFTYGFAYGINSGILDKKKFKPVVAKAWEGLVSHIYEDGRLGDIQPIGAAPGVFTPTSSYVYGTGAFLLAGSEIDKMVR
jgi:rhamnogalacturonyl hydrolase YesR